jgi:SNF2 Helicase protein
MMEIRLTPTGQLRWEAPEGETASAGFASWQHVFHADWREGLLTLAAEKIHADEAPTARYWQALAERYLTALCHISGATETFEVAAPSPADCASLVLTAPPMQGGEYLSAEVLRRIWEALDGWTHEAVAATGGLETFLQTRAPKWHQVGRVCFHLAEHKHDDTRPFAFMATFTAGFGAAGRLQHLPLRKALEQYAGANNRPALIKLLAPVQQAAERCAWVQKLVESGEIYQPMAWSAGRAYQFLQSVPALEESGVSVRLPNWWKKRPRPQVSVKIGTQTPAMFGVDAMLDFDVQMALGDEPLSAEELETLLASEDPLVLLKGQWVEVDRDKLREAIAHWEALRQQAQDGQMWSCTARVRVMNRVFSKLARLIQIIFSASLQSGSHGFSHCVMALCRHTASAGSHDHRPQARQVRTASRAAATVAHGTGAPLSSSTHDRSGRRPWQVSVAATV